jgi:hypothetical protein
MQDFTGVPAVVDLAAMRAAMAQAGGDPNLINPLSPVDLVIDHSVMVDHFAMKMPLLKMSKLRCSVMVSVINFSVGGNLHLTISASSHQVQVFVTKSIWSIWLKRFG